MWFKRTSKVYSYVSWIDNTKEDSAWIIDLMERVSRWLWDLTCKHPKRPFTIQIKRTPDGLGYDKVTYEVTFK